MKKSLYIAFLICIAIVDIKARCEKSTPVSRETIVKLNKEIPQINIKGAGVKTPMHLNNVKKSYAMSNNGLEIIKAHETLQLTAYYDSNGYSIGYGHHGKDVYKGMIISEKQANKYFKNDVAWVNEAINNMISELNPKVKITQNFVDGLGDLIYNCGEAGVRSSTFWKRMMNCRPNNKQDLEYSIAAVKNCRISCKGHIKRRQETMKMMLS